jgi:prepilin-type N-terminal cleavage/methylation domain-containing protein
MKRAFSLLEVLLAMAVLAIGGLSIVGSVIYATRMESSAGRATQALYLANQISDLCKLYNLPVTAPINDGVAARNPVDGPPFAGEIYANDTFRRNIRMTHLDPSGSTYRSQLYQIDVSVYWWERNQEKSVSLTAIHRVP